MFVSWNSLFWEITFQIFLCLFAIRKVGQRKTLSGQRKTLSSQRKIWFDFQESVFPFSCVYFSKSGFQVTTFQTVLCLFVIRKVGQRKTLSSQRKIWFGFQKSVFPFNCVCFSKSGFQVTTFQTVLCLFAIRKVGQRKTLSSQRKIWLGFQESVFLKNLDRKHFSEVVKILEISLFSHYIKFDSQTFD
jgi:hypothetical protein